jgi:hypothetical protein
MARKVAVAAVSLTVAMAAVGGTVFTQSGAPGPGWVQTPAGGWVPPNHPLAGQPAPPTGPDFVCSNATVRGTYAIQMQGTQPLPGGGTQAVIGVVIRTYDGAGGFTQIDNIKGAVTGIVFDRPGFGTYQVNEDCSGSANFEPGPGIQIQERLVVSDAGREIRSIVSSPPPIMVSPISQRVDHR